MFQRYILSLLVCGSVLTAGSAMAAATNNDSLMTLLEAARGNRAVHSSRWFRTTVVEAADSTSSVVVACYMTAHARHGMSMWSTVEELGVPAFFDEVCPSGFIPAAQILDCEDQATVLSWFAGMTDEFESTLSVSQAKSLTEDLVKLGVVTGQFNFSKLRTDLESTLKEIHADYHKNGFEDSLAARKKVLATAIRLAFGQATEDAVVRFVESILGVALPTGFTELAKQAVSQKYARTIEATYS